MKKRGTSAAAKKEKLLPTNAPVLFYDPLQQEFRRPRKGRIRLRTGDKILSCAWAQIDTATLQKVIDEFAAEVLRRALAGEDEAVEKFALNVSGYVSRLQDLTYLQREKVARVALRSPHWPVKVTQRDTDFTWAKDYVRCLEVGSASLLPGKTTSRIDRHKNFARLAEKLWLRLLENRHEMPDLMKAAGRETTRKLKTKWISLCLSLRAVKTAQEVTAQDAHKWWRLGEALLQEGWEQDRQSAFGAVLKDYKGKDAKGKDKYSEAYAKKAIFKQLKSAFLHLLGYGRSSHKSTK